MNTNYYIFVKVKGFVLEKTIKENGSKVEAGGQVKKTFSVAHPNIIEERRASLSLFLHAHLLAGVLSLALS